MDKKTNIPKIIKIIVLLIVYSIICKYIYTTATTAKKINLTNKIYNPIKNNIKEVIKEDTTNEKNKIGTLIIKKLNINENIYEINSTENNVDRNVTILEGSIEPHKENSIFFLAAHSGTGKTAYFKNLDKLNKNDEIILNYKNKTYYYTVKSSWETIKNGEINIEKEEKKQLILTTCSPSNDNNQLILNCIEKESI